MDSRPMLTRSCFRRVLTSAAIAARGPNYRHQPPVALWDHMHKDSGIGSGPFSCKLCHFDTHPPRYTLIF